MRHLGVTRTAAELIGLRQRAAERGFSIVPLPLLETQALEFPWPTEPILRSHDWLVFTSARGVRYFFERLEELNSTLPPNLRVAAVGPRTETALSEFGRNADFVPRGVGGEELFAEFIEKFIAPSDSAFNVVYLSAESPRFDPAPLFLESNESGGAVQFHRIAVYRSVELQLPRAVLADFTSEDKILYTSPLAAQSYARQFGAPVAHSIAIGQTTAKAIRDLGWPEAEVLPEPDVSSALNLVEI